MQAAGRRRQRGARRRGGRDLRHAPQGGLPAGPVRRLLPRCRSAPRGRGRRSTTTCTTWHGATADGYCFFVGRNDDVIKCSGYRIGPFEVESALMEHRAVRGVRRDGAPPTPCRGKVVKATVVLARGYEPSDELDKGAAEPRASTRPRRTSTRASWSSWTSCPRPSAARSSASSSATTTVEDDLFRRPDGRRNSLTLRGDFPLPSPRQPARLFSPCRANCMNLRSSWPSWIPASRQYRDFARWAQMALEELRRDDCDVQVLRASGPGGQCVNTTDSAVRMVHRPKPASPSPRASRAASSATGSCAYRSCAACSRPRHARQKVRRATKPSRRAKEARLADKRRRAETKARRRPVDGE